MDIDIDIDKRIQEFLAAPAFAVVGASTNRAKYGNKVLRVYLQKGKRVYPVNPHEKMIEGIACTADIASLPEDVKSISIITPPPITTKIVTQAIKKGIRNIWMQPGAESEDAILECEQHDVNVIAGGPCILVALGFQEQDQY